MKLDLRGLILLAAAIALASPASAKSKKRGRATKPSNSNERVMIFHPDLPDDQPTVAFDQAQIAKGFDPAVLFTNVTVKPGSESSDDETLEVKEQSVTTEAPAAGKDAKSDKNKKPAK